MELKQTSKEICLHFLQLDNKCIQRLMILGMKLTLNFSFGLSVYSPKVFFLKIERCLSSMSLMGL